MLKYLRDPYNQVFKFTASGDSEFTFNINNHLFWTNQEVYNAIDNVPSDYFPADMDAFSRLFLWVSVNRSTSVSSFGGAYGGGYLPQVLAYLNSWRYGVCSDSSLWMYNLLQHYYPNLGNMVTGPNHTTMEIDGLVFIDTILRLLFYKDKYTLMTLAELQADNKLFTEPIRKTSPYSIYYDFVNYHHINDYHIDNSFASRSNIISAICKIPDTSSFVYPVKSANAISTTNGTYSNAIVTIPIGKVGIVEMPFMLMQVTGTGSVVLDGVTYNLPTDEAALKARCYQLDKYFPSFQITANTGGLVAEFISTVHMELLNKNEVVINASLGSVSCEKVTTDKPIETCIFSVNMGDAESWTNNFQNVFYKNKSYLIPRCHAIDDARRETVFSKSGTKRPQPVFTYNYVKDNLYVVNAGVSVIDQCFASKLMPRNDSFTTSLELSFTQIDASETYYTTDGSTPDATKTLYTAPFTISATTTVKWINIKADYANSHVNTRVITKTA